MALGISLRSTLRGSYHTLSDPGRELPVTLSIGVHVTDLARFVLHRDAEVSGEVDLAELARGRPVAGRLSLSPVRGKLTYELSLEADDGRRLRVHAETEVDPLRPVGSLTEVTGSIYADEGELGRLLLRMPIGPELLQLLTSIRPTT